MPRSLRALVTAAVALATAAVPAAAATAEPAPEVVGIQLVAHPDQAEMGLRGMTAIVADVTVGDRVERQVVVSNDTTGPVRLGVTVGGATVDGQGFRPDDEIGAVASWATLSETSVVLRPGERRRVDVTFTIPVGATNGEHFGVVWVQPPAAEGPVRTVNRVGVRVYLAVSGGVGPFDARPADFTIDDLTAARLDDGRPQVRATVRNAGSRVLDLAGHLTLSAGPGSTAAGPFAVDNVTTLGVGGSTTVTVTLPEDLPAGPWLARLELESGNVVRAAEATLTFPTELATAAAPVATETSAVERQRAVLIPIASSLLLTVLVMLLVLWWGWRRNRRGGGPGEPGGPGGAGPVDWPELPPVPVLVGAVHPTSTI